MQGRPRARGKGLERAEAQGSGPQNAVVSGGQGVQFAVAVQLVGTSAHCHNGLQCWGDAHKPSYEGGGKFAIY